jgi:Fur family ferric uptake transcriptional regulator
MKLRTILKYIAKLRKRCNPCRVREYFDISEGDGLLRLAGLRITWQRRAVMGVLIEANDHPDAVEIQLRTLEKDTRVSQATTYRTLASLCAKGLVRNHIFAGQATRFELANRPHHDHLIDVETGQITEFVSAQIEALGRRIAAAHGYEIVAHRLELYCRKVG